MVKNRIARQSATLACIVLMVAVAVGGALWSLGNDLWVLTLLITAGVEYMLYNICIVVSGKTAGKLVTLNRTTVHKQDTFLRDSDLDEFPADSRAMTPQVNIDGTPMMGGQIDIKGNPYGVIDNHD